MTSSFFRAVSVSVIGLVSFSSSTNLPLLSLFELLFLYKISIFRTVGNLRYISINPPLILSDMAPSHQSETEQFVQAAPFKLQCFVQRCLSHDTSISNTATTTAQEPMHKMIDCLWSPKTGKSESLKSRDTRACAESGARRSVFLQLM
jgi:hypothetical protein